MLQSFRQAVSQARRQSDLCFAVLLDEERILQALGPARSVCRGWIYTPAVTIWVFLSQCFSADHSCREAVARLIAWRVARGLRSCSPETGAYCTARDNLPEEACHRLVQQTGAQTDEQAPAEWRWHGRRVLDVDGATATLADTPANQAEYPQIPGQRPGCGFPIIRFVVVFSLAVGTILDAAIGRYQGKQTGENSLFRTLHPLLREGDVVLADRCFSGWFDMALLHGRGVDVVFRRHQKRTSDGRVRQELGPLDHLVHYPKPRCPAWLSPQQYDALPDTLTFREVRVIVPQKGFRTQSLIVVTSLLDADQFPPDEIAALYRQRWQAELNLRSLKCVLQMDHLRCKTPHRARNEFYMHLVAYNLIRQMMARAAVQAGVQPWTLSFKGTLQTLTSMLPLLATGVCTSHLCQTLLKAIATHVVGNRPDRSEPRVRKRRPKSYTLMTQPRRHYKSPAALTLTTI